VRRPGTRRRLAAGLVLAASAAIGACRASSPSAGGLSVAVPLTPENSFTAGIEGPALGPHRGELSWPYPLDAGIPAHRPVIGRHPGLWEIPIGNYVAPPGLRASLRTRRDYFQPENGEITGMDWNLWNEFGMTPAEFQATLEYTLDMHLAGNRSPMTLGLHSELYTIRADVRTDPEVIRARRGALEAFLAYALGKPEVRFANHRELLEWLRDPVLLPPRL
jgi:hypothetical protein